MNKKTEVEKLAEANAKLVNELFVARERLKDVVEQKLATLLLYSMECKESFKAKSRILEISNEKTKLIEDLIKVTKLKNEFFDIGIDKDKEINAMREVLSGNSEVKFRKNLLIVSLSVVCAILTYLNFA